MRRLRFVGTGSGDTGCPSVHEDLDTGDVIVHGPPLAEPEDVAQLRHLSPGETAIVIPRVLIEDWGPKTGATRQAKVIDVAAFQGLFETFRHTAWRLETRRRYASDEATDTYQQFVSGNAVRWDDAAPYVTTVRRQVAEGKTIGRVRVVDDPPTTGQRYLLANAAHLNHQGEAMQCLWRRDAEALQLSDEDFWIFDSRLVALLRFDDDDNLVDVELITEPAEVVRYSQVRDAARHRAVPYESVAFPAAD